MKKRITFQNFTDTFNKHGRGEQFTYEGLKAIFGYYEDHEEQTGEEIELDVVAICGDWSEYDNLKDYKQDTGDKVETLEELKSNTEILETTNGIVVATY